MINNPWIWRRLHLRNVMRDLWRNQPTSVSEIARRLGTSSPTVSQLLKRLMEDGVIVKTGQKKVYGGRPRNLLHVKPEAAYALVIDVANDAVSTALVDASLDIVARRRHETEGRVSSIVESILKDFEELVSDAGKLVGVSLILPEASRRSVETDLDAFLALQGARLGELLEKKLGTRVKILSGIEVYATGEWLRSSHIPWNYFYLHLGRSLEGVLMLNGGVHATNREPIGRIGGMVYAIDAEGGIEITSLEKAYEKALNDVEGGRKVHLLNLLAVTVTNVVVLAGIRHVVLGGPHSEQLELNDMFEIERKVWENCCEHDITIEKSSAGEDAPFVGGAVHLFEEVLLPIER